MIEGFFGSKTRVKILQQFLLNSEEKYYLRQLARDLALQVNSVRRELKHLESCGLLVSVNYHNSTLSKLKSNEDGDNLPAKVTSSDKKYYEVNKEFILYQEIKALILKAQTMVGQSFLTELQEICTPKLLILTGVFVAQNDFPTDMLLVANVPKLKLMELIKKLEGELGKEINYTVMDENEFKFRKEIVDVFLGKILESKKIVMINEWDLIFTEKNDISPLN
ncbi:MAG: hypothetical protein WCJ57_01105 [Candidatus Falkowbacteria bacterium]